MLLIIFLLILHLVGLAGIVVAIAASDKVRRGMVLALRSLRLHKLRSALSVLGILIGTAAVIALMGFGEGTMQDALEDIRRMGATNIIIRSDKPPEDGGTQQRRIAIYGLTWADYERFTTIGSVTRRLPMRIFPQQIRYLDRMYTGRMVATTPEYVEVNQLELASGRFLVDDDDRHMENVAVLGATTADKLFPFEEPLGQTIRMGSGGNTFFYRVIGVVKERMPTGGSGGSQAAEDFNSDVYIPLQTCKVRYGERVFIRQSGSFSGEQVELSQVTLTVTDMDHVRPAGDVVKELLERYHPKVDYKVTIPLDRLEQAEREKERLTMLMAIIAGISLVVGGIGIMNIMLATVTERTREIGIRRALGAKRRDITLQFLIEAVVQTSLGGMVGVGFGLATLYLWPILAHWVAGSHVPAVINSYSIFISVDASLVIGVFFGLYPALRAARLDPIEALRHE